MAGLPHRSVGTIVPHQAYPTYELYESIMHRLAARYPDRCTLEDWGTLSSGRRILTLRLGPQEGKPGRWPQVLYSGTMHGDETAGYHILLRLAEYLLRENPNGLLDEVLIYINPLANPDGTFLAGNHTISGSRRGNRAGVDLNRNYPDPDDGAHPDGFDYQPETLIFMRAARNHSFDLGLNLHGGAELFNYPWDTYRTRHADTNWWRRVSRTFARTAQESSGDTHYFQDRHHGVTNGHDWYPIAGSRQDYMNYYHRSREATVEISMEKIYPARQLPRLWKHLRPALMGYLAEARLGLRGTVTDSYTGDPIVAHLTLVDYDRDHSSVFSDRVTGSFYRFLPQGEYELNVSAPGYHNRKFSVLVEDGKPTSLQISLEPKRLPARKK